MVSPASLLASFAMQSRLSSFGPIVEATLPLWCVRAALSAAHPATVHRHGIGMDGSTLPESNG